MIKADLSLLGSEREKEERERDIHTQVSLENVSMVCGQKKSGCENKKREKKNKMK